MKLFSIIIPSFNQGAFLRDALASLRCSVRDLYEVLVFDGGSTDNSVELLKAEARQLDYWVSGPDGGQSAAINAGWRRATGRYVTWLNSDDLITAGGLDRLAAYVERTDYPPWVATDSMWISAEGRILRCVRGSEFRVGDLAKGMINVGGPSSFVRRDILEGVGYLREDYRYMMDTEFWYRLAKNGFRYVRFSEYFWALRLHPNAKMSGHLFAESAMQSAAHESWQQKAKEQGEIRQRYYPGATGSLRERMLFRMGRVARLETPLAVLGTLMRRGKTFL